MIDIHSHILPNIDDGSRSIEETFNLIKEAKNVGFEAIVSTSHYMEGYYETNTPEREVWVNAIYENLQAKNIDVKLYLGNEIYMSENMIKLLEEGNYTFIKYLDYYNAVINITEDCIIIAQEAQIKNLNNINERLKDNGININNKDLIRNIAYNYLSTYLDKNKYREETFIKSLKRKQLLWEP